MDSFIANWNALKIPEKYLDYVGSFLPWDPRTQAGLNSHKFIRDQSEYPKTSHIYTVTAKLSSKKLKRQFTLSSPLPPSKTLALVPSDQNPAPASTQSSIVGKFKKKHLKQASLDKFLKVIPLVGETSKRVFVCLLSTEESTRQFYMKQPLKCINVVIRVSLVTTKMQKCI